MNASLLVFDAPKLLILRLSLSMTQDELAAELRIASRTYRSYETGRVNRPGFQLNRRQRFDLLQRMVRVLGLSSYEELLTPRVPEPLLRNQRGGLPVLPCRSHERPYGPPRAAPRRVRRDSASR